MRNEVANRIDEGQLIVTTHQDMHLGSGGRGQKWPTAHHVEVQPCLKRYGRDAVCMFLVASGNW